MSREIKFRFWDKALQKMIFRTLLPYDNEHPDIVIMQFTGLTDKNGREIYEGDVMKDRFGAICQIVYVDFGGYRQLSKMGYSPLNQAEIISSNDIVIGNIYENPELL